MATAVERVQLELEAFRARARRHRIAAEEYESKAAQAREAARLMDEQADDLQELLDNAERGRVPS